VGRGGEQGEMIRAEIFPFSRSVRSCPKLGATTDLFN
jgi:hypothetical protein